MAPSDTVSVISEAG